MDLNIKKRIVAKIDEADMVLVGIGEELDQIIKANKNDTYIKLRKKQKVHGFFLL